MTELESIQIGNYVSVIGGRCGVVRFIGETDFAQGEWFGIELDTPDGKNNGELNGRTYFECLPNHGVFIKSVLSRDTNLRPSSLDIRSNLVTASSRLQKLKEHRESSISSSLGSASFHSSPRIPSQLSSYKNNANTPDESVQKSHAKAERAAATSIQELERNEEKSNRLKELEETIVRMREQNAKEIRHLQQNHENTLEPLQTEREEQISQLQRMEVEIEQQKARIAKFSSEKQERTEEIAQTIAKSNASNRKLESLENKITELNEVIELISLEKETLEMDKEIAEERIDECLTEIEALKVANSLGADRTELSGSTLGHNTIQEMAEENRKLRAAIKALHERTSYEKNDLSKQLRHLQKEVTELVVFKDEVDGLREKQIKSASEVEELKELLDVANAYEGMVEQMTEKNLSLGDKVSELEATVNSLEALRELEEEMEHQHCEYEAELRNEIDSQRVMITDLRQTIASQEAALQDRDRSIQCFREVLTKTRAQVAELKTQLWTELDQNESLKGTTHHALNQTMTLRNWMTSARQYESKANKYKILAEGLQSENSFYKSILPEAILTERDWRILLARLFLERVCKKSNLLLQNLRRDLDSSSVENGPSEDALNSEETYRRLPIQLSLAKQLCFVTFTAKVYVFLLDCRQTTSELFCQIVDVSSTGVSRQLDNSLDDSLQAYTDGNVFSSASLSERLMVSLSEWINHSRVGDLPQCTGILKLRARKYACMLSLSTNTLASTLALIDCHISKSHDTQSDALRRTEQSLEDTALPKAITHSYEQVKSLQVLAQQLSRRIELDLNGSIEDLDGSLVDICDELDALEAYSGQLDATWVILQDKLTYELFQNGLVEELEGFFESSFNPMLESSKERLTSLVKSVCRGAFLDAFALKPESMEAVVTRLSHWETRAQEIRQLLTDSVGLRSTVKELNEALQASNTRMRDLDKLDSHLRVVNQKLESDILRLTDENTALNGKNAFLSNTLTKVQAQSDSALADAQKEKLALDLLIKDMQKQLQRSKEGGRMNIAKSKFSPAGEAEIERYITAIRHLRSEVRTAKAQLARERLSKLDPFTTKSKKKSQVDDESIQLLKKAESLSKEVWIDASLPRLVRLNDTRNPFKQLMADQLILRQTQNKIEKLSCQAAKHARAQNENSQIARAIECGEIAFGSKPSEIERPAVYIGRLMTMKKRPNETNFRDKPSETLQLHLNHGDYRRFVQLLAC
uniref:Glycoside hydrolase putative n=1 Tax=Albugo laibachii Nc14 TaxID=890382 RepID=F0WW31_9STRA|nr:glycoside hydrolase putative [Albugo laibachii Nc14]|eukprot:CCA25638.1 glycoside hydrolase putative [Albugo laibachii Nc14]